MMKTRKKPQSSIAFKILTGVVILLLVFSALVGLVGYQGYTNYVLEQYAEGGFLIARIAAQEIDPEQIDTFLAKGNKTQEYQDVWNKLSDFCNSSGATFVYVIVPDQTDYGHVTFVISTANEFSGFQPFEFGYVRETTNDEYREKYRAIYEEGSQQELVVRDSGYISTNPHISAMIALTDEEGQPHGILVVQRQLDAMVAARWSYLRDILYILVILTIVFIVFMGLYLNRTYIRPVKKITDEASRFAEENTPGREKLTDTIRNKDEIGLLANSIDQMEERIDQYVEDLTRFTADKEHMNTELALAYRIQDGMLPTTFPAFPDRKEFDIYASMDPAKQVGGDFYNYFLVDENHLCLMIADVSGKGIPAALFMMASMILLTNVARSHLSPADIIRQTNQTICSNNKEEMFLTAWLGILDITTGTLTAVNAGHEYPVLYHPGESFTMLKDKHSFVIGGMGDVKYKEYEIQMKPGSKLFLYTDGLPEASDDHSEMFGMNRILDTLNQNLYASPEEVLQQVGKAVNSFENGAEQFDDLTMLCIEYKGKQ